MGTIVVGCGGAGIGGVDRRPGRMARMARSAWGRVEIEKRVIRW